MLYPYETGARIGAGSLRFVALPCLPGFSLSEETRMRRRWTVTIMALVGLSGLALAVAQEPIDALAMSWQERLNAGDAAGVAQLYTPDGVLRHASGEVSSGRAEIEAWAAQTIEAGLVFAVTPTSWEYLSDTIAYGLGSWSAAAPDGTVVAAGEYIGVDVLIDGEWKIHQHFSGTVPNLEDGP